MFVVFSTAAIPAGLSALRGDPDPRAAMGGLSLLTCLPLAGLTYVALVRRRRRSTAPLRESRRSECPLAGLAFPYDRAFIAWSLPLVVALNIGALAVAVYGVMRLQAGATINGGLLTVIGIAVGVMGVRFGLEIVKERITRGALILTPDGISHRSWSFDSECSWQTVLGVNAIAMPAPSIQISNTHGSPAPVFVERSRRWRQAEAKTAPYLIVRAMYLSIDPVLVLETVRFYAANPLLRHELGTQDAIDRVRRGEVLLQEPEARLQA